MTVSRDIYGSQVSGRRDWVDGFFRTWYQFALRDRWDFERGEFVGDVLISSCGWISVMVEKNSQATRLFGEEPMESG